MEEANPSSALDIPIDIYETQALMEKAVTLPLPSRLLQAILLSSFSSHSDISQLYYQIFTQLPFQYLHAFFQVLLPFP